MFKEAVCAQHFYSGFLNESGDSWEGYKDRAEEAMKLRITNFDHKRDCDLGMYNTCTL